MPNTWKVVLLALALFLVVDGSLYYRYNRLVAQTSDPLASAWFEPASANTNGKEAAGAEKTTEDSVRATVRVSGSPSWLKIGPTARSPMSESPSPVSHDLSRGTTR